MSQPVWEGAEDLRPLLRPLGELRLDPSNARRHPDKNLHALRESLARFGQQKPVVAGPDGVVVAGNGMLESARSLGWSHLAAITTTLDELRRRAFAVADNRTAELAGWSFDALREELAAIVENPELAVGWSESEIDALMRGWEPGALNTAILLADSPNSVDEAYQGMPEFSHPSMKPLRSVIVHLKNEESIRLFEEAVGRKLPPTGANRSFFWFPEEPIMVDADSQYDGRPDEQAPES